MAKSTAPNFEQEARSILEQIRTLKQDGSRKDRLLAHRALGALALEWSTKQAKRDPQRLDDLASAIGWESADLSRHRKLATVYTERELKAAMRAARHAELKHFIYLAGVADDSVRTSLTKSLGKHGWSASRLHREIQDRLGKRRQGGRPISPRSAVAAVLELSSRIEADRRLLGKCRSAIRQYARRAGTSTLHSAVRQLEDAVELLRADLLQVLPRTKR